MNMHVGTPSSARAGDTPAKAWLRALEMTAERRFRVQIACGLLHLDGAGKSCGTGSNHNSVVEGFGCSGHPSILADSLRGPPL